MIDRSAHVHTGEQYATRHAQRVAAGLLAVACIGIGSLVTACSASSGPTPTLSAGASQGKALAARLGCAGCHTPNGKSSVGPTWKGIWESQVKLQSGGTATVDAAYIHRSIATPKAQIVKGFSPLMPPFELTDQQVALLTEYIRALK